MSEVMTYADRKEFLIAAATDARNKYETHSAYMDEQWFGLANTELQFRRALCECVFPMVEQLSRDQLQAMMAEELKITLGED